MALWHWLQVTQDTNWQFDYSRLGLIYAKFSTVSQSAKVLESGMRPPRVPPLSTRYHCRRRASHELQAKLRTCSRMRSATGAGLPPPPGRHDVRIYNSSWGGVPPPVLGFSAVPPAVARWQWSAPLFSVSPCVHAMWEPRQPAAVSSVVSLCRHNDVIFRTLRGYVTIPLGCHPGDVNVVLGAVWRPALQMSLRSARQAALPAGRRGSPFSNASGESVLGYP